MADKFFYARNGLQVAPNTRFIAPAGNTAQRPGSSIAGDFRFNTDLGVFEGYYPGNTSWAAIGTTTIPTDPLFNTVRTGNSTVNTFVNASAFLIQDTGSVHSVNSTALAVGNSTVNVIINTTSVSVGANVVMNSSSIGLGNSTVSMVANSTAIKIGNTVVAPTGLTLYSNSAGQGTINATVYTGTSWFSNNATNLNGVPASSYALTSSLSAYQTTSGLAGAVAGLQANNANYLAGIFYTGYWRTDTLTNVSQLNNNSGYITGLNASTSYTVYVMVANSYLYSYGNVYAVGDVYAAYSDLRLKTILGSITGALDKVDRLSGVYYKRNDVAPEVCPALDDRLRVGLIAQDVQAVVPEAVAHIRDVDGNDTEYLTVQYERLVPLLVEAIKELRQEVNDLKAKR